MYLYMDFLLKEDKNILILIFKLLISLVFDLMLKDNYYMNDNIEIIFLIIVLVLLLKQYTIIYLHMLYVQFYYDLIVFLIAFLYYMLIHLIIIFSLFFLFI